MIRNVVRTTTSPWVLCLAIVGSSMISSTAEAQLTGTLQFQVTPTSEYFDDCDPGTQCLVVWCGLIEGTMTFDYVGFDGTFDNYDVSVDWPIHINLCPASLSNPTTAFVGSGTFQINRDFVPSQQLIVDITRPNGPDITINSGLVIPDVAFPAFQDFLAESQPTSETFEITAELIPGANYVRGDANGDGSNDIGDAVFTLNALFVGGSPAPPCDDAADANDDGAIDISDTVFTLSALFIPGSMQPSAPFPNCGEDPTDDLLQCDTFAPCT